eukprot:9842933-Alexandrium_andersonii.AAC.1
MSASLVGSEMCIRDRLPPETSAHLRNGTPSWRCGSRTSSGLGDSCDRGCLLYTSDAADDM